MTARWALTLDCTNASVLAEFWAQALGYVPAPPPDGFTTREEWLRHFEVPEDEWDDIASLVDPEGVLPPLSMLRVPEPRTVKNRLHMDLKVSGGRHVAQETRYTLITAEVARLVALGARVSAECAGPGGELDHVVMADPEGNDFCVV